MYKINNQGDIIMQNKIIFNDKVIKLTNHIFDNKYLLNSYPFKNTFEDAKIWAIELLIKENKPLWVQEILYN